MIIKHNTPISFDTEKCETEPQAALVIKSASIGSLIDLQERVEPQVRWRSRLYVREVPEVEKVCGRITGNPHLTLVSVGCCSRARVCLDRRSETKIFVDPAAFLRTDIVALLLS